MDKQPKPPEELNFEFNKVPEKFFTARKQLC